VQHVECTPSGKYFNGLWTVNLQQQN